jgi:hypothetical protein
MHIANKKLTDGSFDASKAIDEIKNAFAELGTDFIDDKQIVSFFENLEGDAK